MKYTPSKEPMRKQKSFQLNFIKNITSADGFKRKLTEMKIRTDSSQKRKP